jgi:hypothetical protein
MRALVATLTLTVGLISYPHAHAEDIHNYLHNTQDLVHKGQYQEALERYIWFHDHALEQDNNLYGVRLSFALSYWKNLGSLHPRALTALRDTRDNKTALLKTGKGNPNLFADVMGINRTLDEDAKTLDLFK